ncbi:hypothetical protein ACQ5SO_13290 [Rhodovulum sp. DZ06]|uniref:hypothetical protein n=1 Tax=Rhodovulum sp. DZ06 TaxID=3425126 RepID=UPI003D32738B
MVYVAQALFTLVALGLAGLAARYGRGPVPQAYHAEIMKRDGGLPGPGALRVLRAVYRSLAGILAALAVMVLGAALWLLPGAPGATGALLALGALVGAVPTMIATRRVEAESGVRTPWRAAAALGVVGALGGLAALSAG